jgi:O-antigen ligase
MKGFPIDAVVYSVWFVALVFTGRIKNIFQFQAVDWVFLGMIGWGVLSLVTNPWLGNNAFFLLEYARFFVVFRLVMATVSTPAELKSIVVILLVFVMIMAVECIQQKHDPNGIGWAGQSLGWVDPSVLEAGGTGRTRWVSIFDGPGTFNVLFTIGIPIALVLTGRPFGLFLRCVAAMMLAVLMLATYYTGSRGGLIATLAIVGLYLQSKSKMSARGIVIATIVVASVYAFAPRHMTGIRDENRSAQNRVYMWAQGIEMVRYSPIFGVGKGNYRARTGSLIAHNSAIEILGETGLPGLFLWTLLILVAIKGPLAVIAGRHNEPDKAFANAMKLIIVGYFVSANFVTLEYETFYFLLALCVAMGQVYNEPNRLCARDIILAVGLTVAFTVVVKMFASTYF